MFQYARGIDTTRDETGPVRDGPCWAPKMHGDASSQCLTSPSGMVSHDISNLIALTSVLSVLVRIHSFGNMPQCPVSPKAPINNSTHMQTTFTPAIAGHTHRCMDPHTHIKALFYTQFTAYSCHENGHRQLSSIIHRS